MDLRERISENFKNKIADLIDVAAIELEDKIGEFNLDAKVHLKIGDYDFNFIIIYPEDNQ